MLNLRSIFSLLVLIVLLALLILLGNRAVSFFSHAAPTPANIAIDVASVSGDLKPVWLGMSQGGEEDGRGGIMRVGTELPKLRNLKYKYVRIDHVFDREFGFERVKEISDAGFTPIISLSYFPKGSATSDVGVINNWNAWQSAVTNLVSSVSGIKGLNLTGVYYEVWNEPDGESFGSFKVGEGKDYFLLYSKTLEAINRATNVNQFKVGGPALADPRRCSNGLLFVCQEFWLDKFLSQVSKNNSRLDFVSWHRYSKDLNDYIKDYDFVSETLLKYVGLGKPEQLITEWGSVPERSNIHGTNFDAAHFVGAARTMLKRVDLATKFEIKDGPGDKADGWGVLKNDSTEKPTFMAMRLLSQLRPMHLEMNGEGTNVTGIASKDFNGLTLILSNYDPKNSNIEKVPISITNITPGKYKLLKTTINGGLQNGSTTVSNLDLGAGVYSTEELMLQNSVVFWDFQLIK